MITSVVVVVVSETIRGNEKSLLEGSGDDAFDFIKPEDSSFLLLLDRGLPNIGCLRCELQVIEIKATTVPT